MNTLKLICLCFFFSCILFSVVIIYIILICPRGVTIKMYIYFRYVGYISDICLYILQLCMWYFSYVCDISDMSVILNMSTHSMNLTLGGSTLPSLGNVHLELWDRPSEFQHSPTFNVSIMNRKDGIGANKQGGTHKFSVDSYFARPVRLRGRSRRGLNVPDLTRKAAQLYSISNKHFVKVGRNGSPRTTSDNNSVYCELYWSYTYRPTVTMSPYNNNIVVTVIDDFVINVFCYLYLEYWFYLVSFQSYIRDVSGCRNWTALVTSVQW